jgi:hypothetical protein
LPTAPKGLTFPECYDLETVQPTSEYLRLYDRTKRRLSREFGLNF